MRFNLEKFSTVLDGIGKIIRDHADTIGDGTDIVNAETDIKIFIEHHRSDNPRYVREIFQTYESSQSVKSLSAGKKSSGLSQKASL